MLMERVFASLKVHSMKVHVEGACYAIILIPQLGMDSMTPEVS